MKNVATPTMSDRGDMKMIIVRYNENRNITVMINCMRKESSDMMVSWERRGVG